MTGPVTAAAIVTAPELTGCCGAALWIRGREPRCTGCGHRQPVEGQPPQQTRQRAPWRWPGELAGRARARRAGRRAVPR